MEQSLGEIIARAAEIVGPNRYLQALLIAVASLLAASLAGMIINRLCKRWARLSATDVDDRFLTILERPVFMTMLLFGLALATSRLELGERTAWVTLSILKSIGVLVWTRFAIQFANQILDVLRRQRERFLFIDDRTFPLLRNVAVLLIVVISIYALMSAWSIDVTALVASAGIVGLALSFAARDTLANLFAGISILADVPYKYGDFVVLSTGERGMVTHIGIRSSRLLTRDDVEITIPNAVMGNAKIINESGGPHEKYRLRVKVSVAYGSDLEHVCEVLARVARDTPGICPEPAPRVRVRAFGDFGIDIELLSWVERPVERGRMSHELHIAVYKKFAEENIEIPYPKHEVFVKRDADGRVVSGVPE